MLSSQIHDSSTSKGLPSSSCTLCRLRIHATEQAQVSQLVHVGVAQLMHAFVGLRCRHNAQGSRWQAYFPSFRVTLAPMRNEPRPDALTLLCAIKCKQMSIVLLIAVCSHLDCLQDGLPAGHVGQLELLNLIARCLPPFPNRRAEVPLCMGGARGCGAKGIPTKFSN